jgi:bifunctional non-homologous end joining protein LigD
MYHDSREMVAQKSFSFEPMLCNCAERPPDGREWHELKLGRFILIGRRSGRSVHLCSRNQIDFTRRFRDVAKAVADLPNDTVIAGEIVALDGHGQPSFNLLRGFGDAQVIVFYAFDLLMLRGKM